MILLVEFVWTPPGLVRALLPTYVLAIDLTSLLFLTALHPNPAITGNLQQPPMRLPHFSSPPPFQHRHSNHLLFAPPLIDLNDCFLHDGPARTGCEYSCQIAPATIQLHLSDHSIVNISDPLPQRPLSIVSVFPLYSTCSSSYLVLSPSGTTRCEAHQAANPIGECTVSE